MFITLQIYSTPRMFVKIVRRIKQEIYTSHNSTLENLCTKNTPLKIPVPYSRSASALLPHPAAQHIAGEWYPILSSSRQCSTHPKTIIYNMPALSREIKFFQQLKVGGLMVGKAVLLIEARCSAQKGINFAVSNIILTIPLRVM